MAELNLHQQLKQQIDLIDRRINGLRPTDPNKDWFTLELQNLATDESCSEQTLVETNARLSALKQLMHLLMEHCVRVQNPGYANTVGETPDSLLTVQARLPSNVLDSTRDLGFSIEPSLLHHPTPDYQQFDPVSPTAKIVAYLRGLDKSLQIDGGFSAGTEGESLLHELGISDAATQSAMAVLFQSRYHAMNVAMAATDRDVLQVIEFAAGISPRGYQWSQMNPGTIYIESDLPQLMIHKAKLIRNARLAQERGSSGIHHCCAADVLDLQSLLSAVDILDTPNPFSLLTEGLLLYFGKDEMTRFLQNMKTVLTKFPNAVWITDFVTRKNLQELFNSNPEVAAGVRNVFSLTGRSVVQSNPFIDEDCVRNLLAEFELQVLATVPLEKATSLLKLDTEISPEQRSAIVGTRQVWRISSR